MINFPHLRQSYTFHPAWSSPMELSTIEPLVRRTGRCPASAGKLGWVRRRGSLERWRGLCGGFRGHQPLAPDPRPSHPSACPHPPALWHGAGRRRSGMQAGATANGAARRQCQRSEPRTRGGGCYTLADPVSRASGLRMLHLPDLPEGSTRSRECPCM